MDEAAILDGIKIEILRANRMALVNAIVPKRHYDFLRSKFVLSGQDCEEISHKVTRQEQASLFLDKLLQHGPSALDRLCESLHHERTQMSLLRMLNKEYENKKNNCMALFCPSVNRSPGIELAVDADRLPGPETSINIRQRSMSSEATFSMNGSTEADLTDRKIGMEAIDDYSRTSNPPDVNHMTGSNRISPSLNYSQRPRIRRLSEVDETDVPKQGYHNSSQSEA